MPWFLLYIWLSCLPCFLPVRIRNFYHRIRILPVSMDMFNNFQVDKIFKPETTNSSFAETILRKIIIKFHACLPTYHYVQLLIKVGSGFICLATPDPVKQLEYSPPLLYLRVMIVFSLYHKVFIPYKAFLANPALFLLSCKCSSYKSLCKSVLTVNNYFSGTI